MSSHLTCDRNMTARSDESFHQHQSIWNGLRQVFCMYDSAIAGARVSLGLIPLLFRNISFLVTVNMVQHLSEEVRRVQC